MKVMSTVERTGLQIVGDGGNVCLFMLIHLLASRTFTVRRVISVPSASSSYSYRTQKMTFQRLLRRNEIIINPRIVKGLVHR